MGWTIWCLNPGIAIDFSSLQCHDHRWGPPSFLAKRYHDSSGGKAARSWSSLVTFFRCWGVKNEWSYTSVLSARCHGMNRDIIFFRNNILMIGHSCMYFDAQELRLLTFLYIFPLFFYVCTVHCWVVHRKPTLCTGFHQCPATLQPGATAFLSYS
jgi:hypothetical protein